MGFEFKKAFQMETRRWLWLVGLVLCIVVFFQCVELPKGSTLWSIFSQDETTSEKTSSFFSTENSTPNTALSNNMSLPKGAVNGSNSSSSSILDSPELSIPSENDTSWSNTSFAETPGQNENFASGIAVPPVALQPMVSENDTSKSNTSFIEPWNEGIPLSPEQSGNFTSELAVPPVAPAPIVLESDASKSNASFAETRKEDMSLPLEQNGNFTSGSRGPRAPTPPIVSSLTAAPRTISDPILPPPSVTMDVKNVPMPPPLVFVPAAKPKPKMPPKDVLTLSDMNELLIQSYSNPDSVIPQWRTKSDEGLILAKSEIEKAPLANNDGLYAPLYRNASAFRRSYELMEQMFKVYIYKEGDRPVFHKPPLEGIYASEGWFMKLLEANRHFVTKRPEEAHLFYLPFSSRMLEEALYVRNSHSHKNLIRHLKSYLDTISGKYPFWNRTGGADHFPVACHDWAPAETKRIMANCTRALCNADVKEGFKFGKDVSLPETYVRKAKNPLRDVGGKAPSKRKTLAFFAGNMHGYLRPILLQYWGKDNNNDPDMQIFGRLPHSKDNKNYIDYMKSSKYCICPRGYEVNSPRVVEAIFFECVPVIISDNFVPPFFETLNWESFAVFVQEKDIPNLKNILLSIPEKTYFRMYMRVKKVQQHFLWHLKPVKYDLFHMILHSVWYNRVFQFRPRPR